MDLLLEDDTQRCFQPYFNLLEDAQLRDTSKDKGEGRQRVLLGGHSS